MTSTDSSQQAPGAGGTVPAPGAEPRIEDRIPAHAPGIRITPLSGPTRYLLEKPGSTDWQVLDTSEFALFQLMDGNKSVMELLYQDMTQRERLAFENLGRLLGRLARHGFIVGFEPADQEAVEPTSAESSPPPAGSRRLTQPFFRTLSSLSLLREPAFLLGPMRLLCSWPGLIVSILVIMAGSWVASRSPVLASLDPLTWGNPMLDPVSGWSLYPRGVAFLFLSTWLIFQLAALMRSAALEKVPAHIPLLRTRLILGFPSIDLHARALAAATRDSAIRSNLMGMLTPGIIGALSALALAGLAAGQPLDSMLIQGLHKISWAAFLVLLAETCPLLRRSAHYLAEGLLEDRRPIRRSLSFMFRRLPERLLHRHRSTPLESWYLAVGGATLSWLILFFIRGAHFIEASLIPLLNIVLIAESRMMSLLLGGLLVSLALPVFLSFAVVSLVGMHRLGLALGRTEYTYSPMFFAVTGVTVSLAIPLGVLGLSYFSIPTKTYQMLSMGLLTLMATLSPFLSMKISRDYAGARGQSAFRYLSFYYLVTLSFVPLFLTKLEILVPDESVVKFFFGFDSLAFLFLFPFFLYVFVERVGRGFTFVALAVPFAATALFAGNQAGDAQEFYFTDKGVCLLSILSHLSFGVLALLSLPTFVRTSLSPFWILLASSLLLCGLSKVPQLLVFLDATPGQAERTAFTFTVRGISAFLGAFALGAHWVGMRRLARPATVELDPMEGEPSQLLLEGFCHLANDCLWITGAHLGKSRAATIQKGLLAESQRLALPVEMVGSRLRPSPRSEPGPVPELAAKLLPLTLDFLHKIRNIAGEPFLRRLLQQCLGELPWEQCEMVSRHILKQIVGLPVPIRQTGASREALRTFLLDIPLFRFLETEEVDRLIHGLHLHGYGKDEDVVVQGEPGEEFFIVVEGQAAVLVMDFSGIETRVATLSPGDCFGEIALLENVPRTATVRATGELITMALTSANFHRLVVKSTRAHERIEPLVRYGTFLSRVPIFRDLPTSNLLSLCQRFKEERFSAGMDVIRQGDEGDRFFLVKEGQLEVIAEEKKVADLGTGDYFGEIALLTSKPRTATVSTVTDSVLLSIGKEDFYRELSGFMGSLKGLQEMADLRLHQLRQATSGL